MTPHWMTGLAALDITAIAGIAVGFGLLVIVPVVAILTEHQRKMARILHGHSPAEDAAEKSSVIIGLHANLNDKKKADEGDNAVLDELRALRNEVADLRMQVASLQAAPQIAPDPVRQRLSQDA